VAGGNLAKAQDVKEPGRGPAGIGRLDEWAYQ
jgi:hypothetical protein